MADKTLAGIEPGGLGPITLAGTVEAGDLVGDSTGWKVAKQAATAISAVGVVDRAGVSGKIVQLHTRGSIRGASGLTPGVPVYLAESGEVSSTPGANFTQMVGVAISATEWVLAINQGVGSKPSAHITDAPAGGTGAAAGAWDTANNRDIAIATINAIIVALEAHGITVKA